ncbi:MAG TPA: type II secretion system F family protein [Chthonomonadaceae bacterium]|nr:type II secretion system F family protein [Chthonomonadaceae bacterium]
MAGKDKPQSTNGTVERDSALALALFTRQFSTLVDAGLSLVRIMTILEQDAPPPFAAYATELREKLQEGYPLSRIMGERPDLFSGFYVKMIRVGEIGGILEESLNYLADLLEEG